MQLLLYLSLVALLGASQVQAGAVFAHFMVTNSQNYTSNNWENDISLAQEAHIDAFALNIAYEDPSNAASIPAAFSMADSMGFQLFFSFDYAGGPAPWPEPDVISLINTYAGHASYFHFEGQPFVSTFEGPGNAVDWFNIKYQTDCYFMPDWSSLGAKEALSTSAGSVNGLFSWAAWPWGNTDMNTYVDASYLSYLNLSLGLAYMMGVSPWFYTNLPGYNKNWLWRGDDLWFDRWQEIWYVQPDFVEIISWNDYGESHYIGPLQEESMAAFSIGRAPFNYALNMPHDGWRIFLPYVIDTYKNGIATISQEGLSAWFRPQPAAACNAGETTGNTASQYQYEFLPTDVVQDNVFYSALLTESAEVTVSIGGVVQTGTWRNVPNGGIGIYHGNVPFNGNTGDVVVTLSRGGTTLATVSGGSITTSCAETNGYENWNAWVGAQSATNFVSATPTLNLSSQACIAGTGTGNFAGLCSYACQYGYCPISACLCTAMGEPVPAPSPTYPNGYPIAGDDASYSGLCSFDCTHGYCPPQACSTVSAPLSTPTVSDFSPPACTSGQGPGNFAGLCSFACGYGFCPIQICTCTGTGALVLPPAATSGASNGYYLYGDDYGLCSFTCGHGYCPSTACSPGGDASVSGTVTMKPLPCTTMTGAATFTLSEACTAGILSLPTSGPDASSQNNPPGEPSVCNEVCDFYRLLTGTCCGQNGTFANPIEIPPSVTIPYDIPLPSGYVPNVNITLGVPGQYNPNVVYGTDFPTQSVTTILYTTTITSQWVSSYTTTDASGHSTTVYTSSPVQATQTGTTTTRGCGVFPGDTLVQTLLAHVPLASAVTLPAGLCNPNPIPIIIPVHDLPGTDPPCFGTSCAPCLAGACGGQSSEAPQADPGNASADPGDPANDPMSCSADPNPSSETGLCGNGNFPLWDDTTGEMECDFSIEDAPYYMTDCQAEADNNYNDTISALECYVGECSAGAIKRQASNCNPPPTYGQGVPGVCDATFMCSTDSWPNVCNNARSAISVKGQPSVLTYYGQGFHDTGRWHDLHAWAGDSRNTSELRARRDNTANFPTSGGWGLIGCQVEEYPFGNSLQGKATSIANYNDRPTLRLVPGSENGSHGRALGAFIKALKNNNIGTPNPTYCVEIVGSTTTQPSDYCINAGATCNNMCAAAYGPAFILVNNIRGDDLDAAVAAGNTAPQRWDTWFDEVPSRKQVHTLSYDPSLLRQGTTVPVVATMPPQFNTAPAPGLKTYTGVFPNGAWVLEYVVQVGTNLGKTRTLGTQVPRDPVNAAGTNLVWDDVPASFFPSKRSLDGPEEVENRTAIADHNATVYLSNALPLRQHRKLSPRQLNGGSFLDPAVFLDVLLCPLPDDMDSCSDCGGDYAPYTAGQGSDAQYSLTATPTGPGATGPSFSPPAPRPTPPNVNGSPPVYVIYFWTDNSTEYMGFDTSGDIIDACFTSPDWTQGGGADALPSSLTDVAVFGDTCSFSGPSDGDPYADGPYGSLTCNTWADALCNSIIELYGGTCQPTQTFGSLLACSWS